jgi:hypothetical protein
MDFYDLTNLPKDENQDNLWDLFTITFEDISPSEQFLPTITVSEEKMMRVDLVSNDLYDTPKYVDILCDINYLCNPLNVMPGDILFVPAQGQIQLYRKDFSQYKNNFAPLKGDDKTTERDTNRKRYVQNNNKITPVTKEVEQDAIKITDDKIIIG